MTQPQRIAVLAFLFLSITFGMAIATDPPHNDPEGVYCNSCHMSHNSLGGSLTNQSSNPNLCLSCHTLTGVASNWPFATSDQATPGTSGKSHRWDAAMPASSLPGNAFGLRAAANLSNPALQAMLTKFSGVATCSVCHQQHSQSKAPWDPFALGSWPGGDSGTIGTGSTTTVLSNITGTKTWAASQWVGSYVLVASAGAGTSGNVGVSKLITASTANSLTVASAFSIAPASGDTIVINGVAAGTASTGSTASAIIDTTKGWVANAWTNYYVRFVSGALNGQERLISTNTGTQLNVATAFTAAPAVGDSYYIVKAGTTTAASWNITTGASANGTTITLIDTTQTTWTADQWKGYYVKMVSGLNNGLERQITGNNPATTLTTAAFPNASSSGDKYYIKSNRHFMRINSALNDMCVDCHSYRNQADVTTYTGNPLSHPVGKALNNVKDPSQFYMVGREPSAASWAAQQGGRGELNGGTNTNYTNNAVMGLDNEINCLSCHGIHYTDSNSTTVDVP